MEALHPAWIVAGFAALLSGVAWFEVRNSNMRDARTLGALGAGTGLAAALTAFAI